MFSEVVLSVGWNLSFEYGRVCVIAGVLVECLFVCVFLGRG